MKVLSLLEPYASLIKAGVKSVETRSWKTSYRGELYIHASKRVVTKKRLEEKKDAFSLLSCKDFKYGYIIAKCRLIDCILMDDDYLKNIVNNHNEYICGHYELGRYAWVLDNIEVLDVPIKAKGQLSIWNFDNKAFEDINNESNNNPVRDVSIVIFKNKENNILLIRTKKLPEYWQPIGGGVDIGETALMAAIREVQEEIGLVLKNNELFNITEVPYDFGIGTVFCYYVPKAINDLMLNINECEILEYRWFGLNQAIKLPMFDATRLFIKELIKYNKK